MNDFHDLAELRTPPRSIEAEQAVLGGIMLAGKPALDEVVDLLTEDAFFLEQHRLIWRAINALAPRAKRFDPVNLGDWLTRKGYGEEIKGGEYLIDLATTTPSASMVRAYAQIVAEKYLRRQLIEAGAKIADSAFAADAEAIELVGQAQTLVGTLLQAQPAEVSSMEDVMAGAFQELCERHEKGEGMDGLATGFDDFDEILGGLVPGLHLLAGRPKHGKSTLAQNIAEHVALRLKRAVHVVILEMSEKQYAKRVIASVGDVDSQRMRRGTLDDVDWSNVTIAVRRMRGAPLYISKPGTTRVEHICAQVRKQHAKTPLGLVVLDYLQLVDVRMEKGENYATAMGRITRDLVNLATELQVPILCLAQLNREAEKERPKPSHLRDSGSIEADAESVSFVYREDVNNPKSNKKGTVEVIVALNRNGPPGTCRLRFDGAKYRCENLPPDWEPPTEEGEEAKPTRKRFGRSGHSHADAAAGSRE